MTRDLIAEIEKVRSCKGSWSWLLEELVGSRQLWLRACRQTLPPFHLPVMATQSIHRTVSGAPGYLDQIWGCYRLLSAISAH